MQPNAPQPQDSILNCTSAVSQIATQEKQLFLIKGKQEKWLSGFSIFMFYG
jgi:hypothetical protein